MALRWSTCFVKCQIYCHGCPSLPRRTPSKRCSCLSLLHSPHRAGKMCPPASNVRRLPQSKIPSLQVQRLIISLRFHSAGRQDVRTASERLYKQLLHLTLKFHSSGFFLSNQWMTVVVIPQQALILCLFGANHFLLFNTNLKPSLTTLLPDHASGLAPIQLLADLRFACVSGEGLRWHPWRQRVRWQLPCITIGFAAFHPSPMPAISLSRPFSWFPSNQTRGSPAGWWIALKQSKHPPPPKKPAHPATVILSSFKTPPWLHHP